MRCKVLPGIVIGVLLASGTIHGIGEAAQLPGIKEARLLSVPHSGGSKEEIDTVFGRMERANMNVILPQVYYGYVYWDSQVALTRERQPSFDRLEYVAERAYEKGIEVHPMINISLERPSRILAGTPSDPYKRFDVDRGIPAGRVCFHYGGFREFMAEITRELVENYKIHGINLDLIRTRGRVCLCEECKEKYRAEYGRDLVEDSREAGPEIIEWQEAGVGGLVRIVAETAKGINPEIKTSICAYIAASPSRRGMQGQVPHVWAEKGWVDFILPMVYTDRGDMGGRLQSILDYQAAMDPDIVYPHLDLINRGGGNIPKDPEVVLEQIETVRREADVKGMGFYFHRYLTDKIAEALGEGSFREKAVLPWRD